MQIMSGPGSVINEQVADIKQRKNRYKSRGKIKQTTILCKVLPYKHKVMSNILEKHFVSKEDKGTQVDEVAIEQKYEQRRKLVSKKRSVSSKLQFK